MRKLLKNRSRRGFTLLIGLAVLAVYPIGAYLVVNPRPDRVYESEPSSAIVAPADDETLAARGDSADGIFCNCLLKDRSRCIECAVADVSSLELVPANGRPLQLSTGGGA